MNDTKTGSFKIIILNGIPVYVHWSFPAGGLLISSFFKFALPDTIYFCIAYTLLIILHELSHAAAACNFGLKVLSIEISGAGGLCRTEFPRTFITAIVFSSAGILAQALLLVGTFSYLEIVGNPTSIFGKCIAITFMFIKV
jgi:hypothetical protein